MSFVAGGLAVKWSLDELRAIGLGEVPAAGKPAVPGGMAAGVLGLLFAGGLLVAYFGLIASLVALIVLGG